MTALSLTVSGHSIYLPIIIFICDLIAPLLDAFIQLQNSVTRENVAI